MAYDINQHLDQLRADQEASEAEFKAMIAYAEKDAKVGRVMLLVAAALMVLGSVLKLVALGLH